MDGGNTIFIIFAKGHELLFGLVKLIDIFIARFYPFYYS